MSVQSPALHRELRRAGISSNETPTLQVLERRRLQLWMLAAFVIIAVAVAALINSLELDQEKYWWARQEALQISLLALAVGFVLYAIEKELHLRRLTLQLLEERSVSAALSTRIDELRALMDAGKAVNSVLELDDVLQIILSSALELLGGSDGSVMLTQDDGSLTAVCVYGNERAHGVRVPVGSGIAGRVALTGEPLLITGAADAETFPGHVDREHPVDSAMSVPLKNRDELLGVLNCNASAGRVFSDYDLHAFALFAEQAAAAIANARLYELQRAHIEQLLQLDEMKNEFIASVSHDLRTPLTSIVGSASVAMRQDLPETSRQELLTSIRRQADRLETMVRQLLDAAAIQRERAVVEAEPVDLIERLRAATAELAIEGVAVELEGPASCIINGSPSSIDRVILNLLDNATKHGRPPIRVVASVDDRWGTFSVIDTGPGIPPDDRERVFDRFYRTDPSRSETGLGLGLSIVRSIARAHGGDVWVDDRSDGGAISVRFPLPSDEAKTA